jgi:hypothetical protein
MRLAILALGAISVTVWAQSDHPNLSGTWLLDMSKSQTAAGRPGTITWVIDEKDDTITLKETAKDDSGHEHDVNVNCGLGGKECSYKDEGGEEKAMFWYNGPVLVQMTTGAKNNRVSKTRMKVTDNGKTLEVEVKSIVPAVDKTDRLVFTKQDQSAAALAK